MALSNKEFNYNVLRAFHKHSNNLDVFEALLLFWKDNDTTIAQDKMLNHLSDELRSDLAACPERYLLGTRYENNNQG